MDKLLVTPPFLLFLIVNGFVLLAAVRYHWHTQAHLAAVEGMTTRRLPWYHQRNEARAEHHQARFMLLAVLVWEGLGQWLLFAGVFGFGF